MTFFYKRISPIIWFGFLAVFFFIFFAQSPRFWPDFEFAGSDPASGDGDHRLPRHAAKLPTRTRGPDKDAAMWFWHLTDIRCA